MRSSTSRCCRKLDAMCWRRSDISPPAETPELMSCTVFASFSDRTRLPSSRSAASSSLPVAISFATWFISSLNWPNSGRAARMNALSMVCPARRLDDIS